MIRSLPYTDTHAQLLCMSGRKQEVLQFREAAISKAKAAGIPQITLLGQTLNRMKAGKL
jgi:hypothetical protein